MKFAHIRVSEYFTFAKQIFHSEAISLARRANFVEKSTSFEVLFSEFTQQFRTLVNSISENMLTEAPLRFAPFRRMDIGSPLLPDCQSCEKPRNSVDQAPAVPPR